MTPDEAFEHITRLQDERLTLLDGGAPTAERYQRFAGLYLREAELWRSIARASGLSLDSMPEWSVQAAFAAAWFANDHAERYAQYARDVISRDGKA